MKYPKRFCNTCGRKLTVSEVAAEVKGGLGRWSWCMACWDAPNEIALREYRAAHSFGPVTEESA